MILVVKERQRLSCSNGAVATLLNEPKVSSLIDDNWASAKEEEINYRVVDEAVNNDDSNNDDDDVKYQALNRTKWWSPWLPPAPKSDKTTPARVELIDKRFIFEAETTTNG